MDGGIVGSLIGLDLFKHDYGYEYNCSYIVAAHWVSAFNYANKLGGIVGALASGFAYDKLGPRRMMAACLTMSIAFIFL